MNESPNYRVRLYDGFDNVWMDVSELCTLQEASNIWLKKTKQGAEKIKFDDIDYYAVWNPNGIVNPLIPKPGLGKSKMNQTHLERLHTILTAQLTNFESNGLLNLEDKVNLSEILANLCNAITTLSYVSDGDKGEGWKE